VGGKGQPTIYNINKGCPLPIHMIADQYYYNKRATYYWARLYSSQMREGRAYNN